MSATGSELYLNFQTRRAGYIKVEVVDAKGRALANCDPPVGDHLKAKVPWKGESKLDGDTETVPTAFPPAGSADLQL
jgi:hypothetical protein